MSVAAGASPNRALLFLFHDAEGLLDDSVSFLLRSLRSEVKLLFVVSNGALQRSARDELAGIANVVLERENTGFDVGAYRAAFEEIGWDEISRYDEILLANSTFFGPVTSFTPLFATMSKQDVDFWGITDHPAVTPHPYTGKGTMPAHLQSYWLLIRKSLAASADFREYWEGLPLPRTYSEVVTEFEAQFTQHFANLGYSWSCAFPHEEYGVENPAMEAPLALLESGCPIFKKRLYFHNIVWLSHQGVFPGAVTRCAVELGYPEDLVVAGIFRKTSSRDLSSALDATYLIPDPFPNAQALSGGFAEGIVRPTAGATHGVGARRTGRPWKMLCEEGLDALMGTSEFLIIDAPAPGPGNLSDMSITTYAYACGGVCAAGDHIGTLFKDHPRLLAVFPYTQTLTEHAPGRGWISRIQAASEVATSLGLVEPFNFSSAIGPYRGIAAYRRELLQEMAQRVGRAGGWKSLAEVAGSESRLESILDLLAADVARMECGFVGQSGTASELRRTASLLQDVHSRTPSVPCGYLDYPYSGPVILPNARNKVGKVILESSPGLFRVLRDAELWFRGAIQKVGRKSR